MPAMPSRTSASCSGGGSDAAPCRQIRRFVTVSGDGNAVAVVLTIRHDGMVRRRDVERSRRSAPRFPDPVVRGAFAASRRSHSRPSPGSALSASCTATSTGRALVAATSAACDRARRADTGHFRAPPARDVVPEGQVVPRSTADSSREFTDRVERDGGHSSVRARSRRTSGRATRRPSDVARGAEPTALPSRPGRDAATVHRR
jgi:hypothetical protein